MLFLKMFFSFCALMLVAAVIAYFVALYFHFNVAIAIVLVSLPVLLLTYFLKKFNVRVHDEHILTQVESFCEGHYYRNPEWQRAFAAYERRHPLGQLSRGGVVSLVRRFYRFSPLNFKAAIWLTVVIYGYVRFISLTDGLGRNPAELESFLLWNLWLPALIFLLSFMISGFFTGVPGKIWRKQVRRSRAKHKSGQRGGFFPDPEKLFDSAKYLSAGESLFIFGKRHLLMANPDGVMAVPWSSVTQVTRAALIFPVYRHPEGGDKSYWGTEMLRGVIITFRHEYNAPDVPKYWQGSEYEIGCFRKDGDCYTLPEITEDAGPDYEPDSLREMVLQDAARGTGRTPGGYPVTHAEFFPMNEFDMHIFIKEICQRFRLPLKEPCDVSKRFSHEFWGHDYGHYDLSDFF